MRWDEKISLRGLFSDLIDEHRLASPTVRRMLEPVIFSKTVDWRKDARRGQVPEEERLAMEQRIRDYTRRLST
jgi:hypothetical protein